MMWFQELLTPPGYPARLGDPGLLGWSICAAYFISAGLCWSAARSLEQGARSDEDRRIILFWRLLALMLVLLGLNKQLDFQTWIIWLGEQAARAAGLYEERRKIQLLFFLLLAWCGLNVILLWIWRLRGRWREHALALAGSGGLALFVIIRAGNFNHVLSPLWMHLHLGTRDDPAHYLELFSILLMGCGAVQVLLRTGKARRPGSARG
jgi:hypothetical protein